MRARDSHHSQSKHSFDNNNKIFITLSKQDYCRDLHYLNVFTRNLLVWLCWWLERSAMMKMALRYTITWNLETAWTAFSFKQMADTRYDHWRLAVSITWNWETAWTTFTFKQMADTRYDHWRHRNAFQTVDVFRASVCNGERAKLVKINNHSNVIYPLFLILEKQKGWCWCIITNKWLYSVRLFLPKVVDNI